jgi:hypothetical protein
MMNPAFQFLDTTTLHHLPLGPALTRFRSLLKSGGVLGVIGLYRARTAKDFALAAAALPTSWTMRCLRDYTNVEHLCRSQKRRCTKYGPHAMGHCTAALFADICFSDTRWSGVSHEALARFGLSASAILCCCIKTSES